MQHSKGMMVILSSPSGGGKTSIAKRLLELDKNLWLSISATTRTPRVSEAEGVDYFFKSKDAFNQMLHSDQFLEHAIVYGNLYGTPRKYVEDYLGQGFNVLFDVDSQGAYQIMERVETKVVSIFILPPNIDELKKRLQLRSQDSKETISERLAIAEGEMKNAKNYDYVVVNDSFEKAVLEIQEIIESERRKI